MHLSNFSVFDESIFDKELERKMDFAAKNLEFERSAELRDQISSIQEQKEHNTVTKRLKKQ